MFDIYGNPLRAGHCEVHPDVPSPFPCPKCTGEGRQPAPEPCEGCYYAKGDVDYCDGTCKTLPMSEWKYFKGQ